MALTARPRWIVGLEAHAARLRNLAQARRTITPVDAGADALDYAAADVEQLIHGLQEPTRMLSCEEWAAEQEPAVTGKTARRWYHLGELEGTETPSGIRIAAGARRIPRAPVEGAGVGLHLGVDIEARAAEIERADLEQAS